MNVPDEKDEAILADMAKKELAGHTQPDSEWYSTPPEKRKRKGIMLTLSPEALRKLKRLSDAAGEPRSQVVERLVMGAKG